MVLVETETAEERKGGEGGGNVAGELVVGEVEKGEAFEAGDELRDRARDGGPADHERLQAFDGADRRRNGAHELGLPREDERVQVRDLGELHRNLAGEAFGVDSDGGDAVGGLVAGDEGPSAAVGFRVPRGEDVRVFEGVLDFEKDHLVLFVAKLG